MSAPLDPAMASVEALAACALEPIHIPGAIQPQGALVSVGLADLVVRQCSANCAHWLARAPDELTGRPLHATLPAIATALRAALARGIEAPTALRAALALTDGRPLHVVAHRVGAVALVEIEPADDVASDHLEPLGALIAESAAADSIAAVGEAVAHAVRAMSGYDRVMIYRFHRDGHGEVIAESVAPGVEAFLGLHYPASDIPTQARAVFLVNRVRVIADSAHRPWPLVPTVDADGPLDLSRTALRAVSPIHLEYLRNMRVGASLTVAVVVDGALWGLIACHHLQPRGAGHALRRAVDLAAGLYAARIGELDGKRRLDAQLRADRLQRDLLAGFTADDADDWGAALMRPERILPLVGADGAILATGGALIGAGELPGSAAVAELVRAARERTAGGVVWSTDAAGREVAPLAPHGARASGVLAVRLAPDGDDVLLWLRGEIVRTVTWGGDPAKPVAAAAGAAGERLSPRTSFAAWRQTVRGMSREWTVEDRAAAEAIVQHVHAVVLRVYEVKRALARSNRELTEFASAASHDLQEPLRTMWRACETLDERIGAGLERDTREYLRLAIDGAKRGQELVQDLLSFARVDYVGDQAEAVDMTKAVHEAREALGGAIAASDARIVVEGLPTVVGHARLLTQLWQNLIGNAVKYHGDAAPVVRISAQRRAGAWEFAVADNGIGIDPRFHERIFTIFKRLHARSKYPGTGVGLALCKKIVALHGGRIWVDSRPGEGATFRFTIADADRDDG